MGEENSSMRTWQGIVILVAIAVILFASLRERLEISKIPRPFQGAAIALITAGILAMAFMGFSGLVK